MRLYAVTLITWAAIVTASSDLNSNANLSEKVVGYTEFHDLSAKQIAQPYVTGIEARNSGQTGIKDHSDDVANAGLSRSAVHVDEERGSSSVSITDTSSSVPSIYATPLVETIDKRTFERHPGSESSEYIIPEDVLLVENAGHFGQRVRQDYLSDQAIIRTAITDTIDGQQKDDEYTNFRKSYSSTLSPLEDGERSTRPFVSTTREPFVLALKKESDLTYNDTLPNDFEIIGSETRNFDRPYDGENSTEILPLSKADVATIYENDVVPEILPRPEARSSRRRTANNGTANDITKKSESIKNTRTSTPVEIGPSLKTGKFSGPIVVPDLPNGEIQDVAIDYLDDNDAFTSSVGSAGIITENNVDSTKAAASNGVAMSSIMLNPLQVGITLVNADQTALINDNEQTTNYHQDDLQRLATVNKEFVESDRNRSSIIYANYNIEKEVPAEAVVQKIPDSSVEIQKSIEIYHTAPVHEIHYPPEYIQQTTNLGIIETNNIGALQRSKQPHGRNEQSELRQNYDIYRANDQTDKSIVKAQELNRHEYNDVGKPMASTVIAAYSNIQEEMPREALELRPLKYNNAQPVLSVPNHFDDTLYDQSNIRHIFNDNDNAVSHAKFTAGLTRPETTSKLVQSYMPYREQQSQSNQPIDYQHPFIRPPETKRPEASQLLLRIIPNGSTADGSFVVPISRPYPIEKIIEKTVHVPHPIEIEKIIEKKVPFPVERLVEKQVPVPVPVPQPYPVHVQVPIDRVVEKQIRVPHIYPIHVERTIEKKVVPYTFQRLLVQPTASYPLHVRLPASIYPASMHVTAPLGKATTDISAYRIDAERSPNDSGSIDAKFNRYHQKVLREPVANLGGFSFEPLSHPPGALNATQFYSVSYKPSAYDHYNIDIANNYVPTTHLSNIRFMILPKKFVGGDRGLINGQHATTTSSYAIPAVSPTRQILYNLVERNKAIKDEYVGPAPPRKISPNKAFSQMKSSQLSGINAAQSLTTAAVLRRSREPGTQYPGSFRQSKMEYGFKPPMVPSIQYDENTASKVEN